MSRAEINEEEKIIFKSLLKFFETNKYSDMDKEIDGILEEAISRVFQLEMENLNLKYNPDSNNFKNDIIMKIIDDSKKTIRGNEKSGKKIEFGEKVLYKKKSKIVYNKANLYINLSDEDSKVRLLACKRLFMTIFHEIEHLIQHRLVDQCISSKDTLMYARDFGLKELMRENFCKGKNYLNLSIEASARKKAYEKYMEVMGEYEPEIAFMRDIEEGILYFGEYESNIESGPRDITAIKLLNQIIYDQDRLDILEKYPALYKEYDEEGKRRNAFQLLYRMVKEEKILQEEKGKTKEEKEKLLGDSREMYYELIYIQLENISESDFLEFSKKMDELGKNDLINQMIQYMEKEENKRIRIANKMIYARKCLNYEIKETAESMEEKIKKEYGVKKDLLLKSEIIRKFENKSIKYEKQNLKEIKNNGESLEER